MGQKRINFLLNMPLIYEQEKFVCVHAGIDFSINLKQQVSSVTGWVREKFLYRKIPNTF